MIYDHKVKVNGRWYGAGEDVPAPVSVKTEPKAVAEDTTKVEVAQPTVNTVKRSYTKRK